MYLGLVVWVRICIWIWARVGFDGLILGLTFCFWTFGRVGILIWDENLVLRFGFGVVVLELCLSLDRV